MSATTNYSSAFARDLAGQHVVVIGGSSGIGLAVAQRALRLGAGVTLAARSVERLALAKSRLTADGPADVRLRPLDIRDAAAVTEVLAGIDAPQHVYISAAAFAGGSLLDESLDAARDALEARIWGALHVVRAVASRMRGPDASFVLTGGISTDRPAKGAWPTALGTAGVEQLARLLALELAPLRVNAVAPGWTDTPMWDALLGVQKADTFASVRAQIPTGRLATADEVAEVVTMLMTNRAMNGEVIHVDGGHRLR